MYMFSIFQNLNKIYSVKLSLNFFCTIYFSNMQILCKKCVYLVYGRQDNLSLVIILLMSSSLINLKTKLNDYYLDQIRNAKIPKTEIFRRLDQSRKYGFSQPFCTLDFNYCMNLMIFNYLHCYFIQSLLELEKNKPIKKIGCSFFSRFICYK